MTAHNVYLNGKILPAEAACVSVFDAGLLHGASTFTTMLAHHGKVFRFDRHLHRLMETVNLLHIRTADDVATLTEAVYDLLRANGLHRARLRITLTPGSTRGGEPTTLITADDLPPYPPQWYEKGIPVIVSSFRQAAGDPTFGYKTGCYLPRLLARQEAADKGCEEALWYTVDHTLAEACFCNVFCVLDGKVRTPPVNTPVLPGICREAVLELCGTMGIDRDDAEPLTVRDMLAAQEIFLTGSTTLIRPVVRVERHIVGDETPGPLTKRLMAALAELLDRECPA